jgi:hypothetical protein
MGTVLTFPKGVDVLVLEPEEMHAVGIAFDNLCELLQVRANSVREAIAAKVMAHAQLGERDPDRLRDAVLREMGVYHRMQRWLNINKNPCPSRNQAQIREFEVSQVGP